MQNTYTAIITARGGSKGLPRKNVLDLAGKPMIAHTIIAALDSGCFNRVVVTTDCPEIKSVSLEWGAEVIDRPVVLASDTASSLDVIHHALTELHKEGALTSHFILLQPTSPLRNAKHIKEAVGLFENSRAASLVSVTEAEHPVQKHFFERDGQLEPVFSWEDLTKPRQELEKAYLVNGAIYIAKASFFISKIDFFQKPVKNYLMPKDESIDVDDINHLNVALKSIEH